MNVYLAGPYQWKNTINTRAAELRALGIGVTSRWLEEKESPSIQLRDVTYETRQQYAVQDVDDIAYADVFVLQPDQTNSIPRQGRTVELGIAIGFGETRSYPIFVVGSGEENIFHTLPQVTHFSDWEATKARLVELAEIEKFRDQDDLPF